MAVTRFLLGKIMWVNYYKVSATLRQYSAINIPPDRIRILCICIIHNNTTRKRSLTCTWNPYIKQQLQKKLNVSGQLIRSTLKHRHSTSGCQWLVLLAQIANANCKFLWSLLSKVKAINRHKHKQPGQQQCNNFIVNFGMPISPKEKKTKRNEHTVKPKV